MHYRPHRVRRLHHVFQNLVDDVLLKNSQIAIAEQVLLERFKLQAAFPGHVADGEHAEIRQAGLGTNRCQFRIIDCDLVAGKLIFPRLDGRKLVIQSGLGVVVGIAGLWCHPFIVRNRGMERDAGVSQRQMFLQMNGRGRNFLLPGARVPSPIY